ncbi:50S ribosomal protein L35 [Desulfurispira natronophila]|uniref:Large ribosomal subunit protein bL35 n=1 Tax=Desulfurispira natronophila TaxID=682562 RepID=A0A7W8DGZ1_9BACT|nr:50S ribosomal protein L35 [Desulfurispira natronophila]MBB5022036.1 large subunit ribosomal protein L35 [Desulfurispira natronophila]
MYKIKTKRAAAKRFKTTGSGKIRRNQAFMRHILTKKSSKRKQQLRDTALVDAADVSNVKRMIPYG